MGRELMMWAGPVFVVVAAARSPATIAQVSDEPAPTVTASSLLPPSRLSGPHYKVDEDVVVQEYFYQFGLSSDFGPFGALGLSQLTTRIDEVRALAALQDVSKSAVFVQAAGGAIVNIGKGAAAAVTNPTETAKGLGAGLKRFGVNLGRASKRAMNTEGGADTGESGPESAANAILGVSSAMRRWAQKVGADPYTTNLVLRDALKSIADVDVAGSIATKIVLPIPALVGTVSTVGNLVWSMDPEALRKLNEQRVRTLGTPDRVAAAFFKNGWYTLTLQTRIIAALDAVKVSGCTDYLDSASVAENEREALFFVESAEMLQRVHAQTPVDRLLIDSRAVVAVQGATAVALLPLDYIHATRGALDTLSEMAGRAQRELDATRLELRLTGQVSPRLKREASGFGWTIVEGVPGS